MRCNVQGYHLIFNELLIIEGSSCSVNDLHIVIVT
jgi:hypothetical protein